MSSIWVLIGAWGISRVVSTAICRYIVEHPRVSRVGKLEQRLAHLELVYIHNQWDIVAMHDRIDALIPKVKDVIIAICLLMMLTYTVSVPSIS